MDLSVPGRSLDDQKSGVIAFRIFHTGPKEPQAIRRRRLASGYARDLRVILQTDKAGGGRRIIDGLDANSFQPREKDAALTERLRLRSNDPDVTETGTRESEDAQSYAKRDLGRRDESIPREKVPGLVNRAEGCVLDRYNAGARTAPLHRRKNIGETRARQCAHS